MQAVSRQDRLSVGHRLPVCSLLLSPSLIETFRSNARIRGLEWRAYLVSLLTHTESLVNQPDTMNEGPLTKYQNTGQGLRKVNVRMDWNHWVQFTILARGLGVSNCLLIAHLIALDTALRTAVEKGAAVPTNQIRNGDPRRIESLTGRVRVFFFSSGMERSLQLVSRARDPRRDAIKERAIKEWIERLRRRL